MQQKRPVYCPVKAPGALAKSRFPVAPRAGRAGWGGASQTPQPLCQNQKPRLQEDTQRKESLPLQLEALTVVEEICEQTLHVLSSPDLQGQCHQGR